MILCEEAKSERGETGKEKEILSQDFTKTRLRESFEKGKILSDLIALNKKVSYQDGRGY